MKQLFSLLVFPFIITTSVCAQNWTWIEGTNTYDQNGVYGTMGVGAPGNNPGARHGQCYWTSQNGELWIYSGVGYSISGGYMSLSDMWKYTPSTGNWTWVSGTNGPSLTTNHGTQGVAAPSNTPGYRRDAGMWIDNSGNLWLMGGYSTNNYGNDLWKYDITTNLWTWVKGSNVAYANPVYGTQGVSAPANTPGGRNGMMTWVDTAGNFWLFGGHCKDAAGNLEVLNDLWKYNIATNEWTWIKGSTAMGPSCAGTYGTQTVSGPSNTPGARMYCSTWIDANNKLWLFGGSGFGSNYSSNEGMLNDLWKYDPVTNRWTWMTGSNIINQSGNYGTINVPAASNNPPPRMLSYAGITQSGRLLLFAGSSNATETGGMNDLWRYDPATNYWTWIKGSSSNGNPPAVYGTQNVTAPANDPGNRRSGSSWSTQNGNFYIFGGRVNDALFTQYDYDNTWVYNECIATTSTTNFSVCSNALPYVWNSNSYSSSGTYSVILTGSQGCDSIATLNLTVRSTSSSTTSTTVCANNLPYSWNSNSYSSAGTYSVTLTNSQGCDSVATLNLSVNSTSSSTTNTTICSNALPYSWNSNSYSTAGSYNVTLTNAAGCDSVATLNLSVNQTTSSSSSVTICADDLPYVWNSLTCSSPGLYSVSLTNSVGCDSTANLQLSVQTIDTSTVTAGPTVTANQNGATYQWLNCSNNQPIAGATTQSYMAVANGYYAVIVTLNGCSDTSGCVYVIANAVEETTPSTFTLYPNPSSSFIHISGSEIIKEVTLRDIAGKIVYTVSGVNSNQFTLDGSSLASGVYVMTINGITQQQPVIRE